MAELRCMRGCCWSPLAWRSSLWCDIRCLRFRRGYRIRKYSYPIIDFYGPRRAWRGNLDFHSRLGFWSHQLQIRLFYFIRLDRFSLQGDGKVGSSSYAFWVIFQARKNWDKTHINISNLYCDSISDMGYNTMSLIYIYLIEYGELSWILWLLDELVMKHGPSQSAPSNYLIFSIHVSWLLSFCNPPPQFFHLSYGFAYMKPISHCACSTAHSGCSIRMRLHPFCGWHHNL